MDDLNDIRRLRASKYNEAKEPTARSRSRSPRDSAGDVVMIDGPVEFRVLSWNIDGLDDRTNEEDIIGRWLAVQEVINSEQVHVVLLQEVIEFSYQLISSLLSKSFYVLKQCDPALPYFTIILVHRPSTLLLSHETAPFITSRMGRAVQSVAVCLRDRREVRLTVFNTHLESGKESAMERTRQAARLADEASGSGIIAGDLNIRDGEVPEEWRSRDCWALAGGEKSEQYTWDLTLNDNTQMGSGFKPKFRFDRMYVLGQQLRVRKFKLVGKERVQGLGRFPSDHFGILTTFQLD